MEQVRGRATNRLLTPNRDEERLLFHHHAATDTGIAKPNTLGLKAGATLDGAGTPMEIGTLLLQREVLEKALTPYFNSLLRRLPVAIAACASPAGGSPGAFRPSELVRLGVSSAWNGAPLGSLWGIQAPAVQPLDVRLRVGCPHHFATLQRSVSQ